MIRAERRCKPCVRHPQLPLTFVKTEQQHGEPSRRDPPCTCTTAPVTKRSPDLSEAWVVASVSTKPCLPSGFFISMFLCAVSMAPPALVAVEPWKARGSIIRPSMISFAPVVDLTGDGLDMHLHSMPAKPSPIQSNPDQIRSDQFEAMNG